jgi:hypothetical protein
MPSEIRKYVATVTLPTSNTANAVARYRTRARREYGRI